MPRSLRRLIIMLGDQLDRYSYAFDGFDSSQDAVNLLIRNALMLSADGPTGKEYGKTEQTENKRD